MTTIDKFFVRQYLYGYFQSLLNIVMLFYIYQLVQCTLRPFNQAAQKHRAGNRFVAEMIFFISNG